MFDRNPFKRPSAEDIPTHESFLYFVWEREAIRIAKENGHKGELTHDPILKEYRFCNIRRRDDRVSKWLIEEMYTPYFFNGGDDLWFVAAVSRLINWPPALYEVLVSGCLTNDCEEFDVELFVKTLEDLTTSGKKVYSGAYMTYPGREPGSSKSRFFAEKILTPLIQIRGTIRDAVKSNSVENVVSVISRSFGLSTFMAGQIAADLTYFDSELGKALDLYTFAPLGPGSQAGLNYLTGRKVSSSWKQEEFNEELMIALHLINKELGIENLTLHDVQNCFCEYSKYSRTVLGQGKPRNKYVPETAF